MKCSVRQNPGSPHAVGRALADATRILVLVDFDFSHLT